MPVTSTSLVRSTTIFLIVGFIALLAIVGASLWLVQRTQVYFEQMVAAREARATTTELRRLLYEVERGQRGFLLTNELTYLAPYEAVRETVIPQYERFRATVRVYPELAAEAERIRQTIDDKLTELDTTVNLARGGNRDGALAIVLTDRGKALMEDAQALFAAVVRETDLRQTEAVEGQRSAANALRWTTILGAGVILLVIGGSVWTAVRYTGDLLRARREVDVLNTGLEERVKERTVDLGRANEEIQRFAYIVTHDLRAPLVNIMGFTSELDSGVSAVRRYFEAEDDARNGNQEAEARLAATEDMPEAIGFIRSSTQKMDGLINAILRLSREGRRPLKPERLELQPLFEATVSAIQHQIEEAEGDVSLDVRVPSITSDRVAVEQVVGNLLDNAVKYRDRTRPLAISIRTRDEPGRRVAIEIEDNGRGIAEQDHERVFELFRRSGVQDQKGEGIGLPHVRGIVRTMGGDVTVSSMLGHGSVFTVVLPKDLRTIPNFGAGGANP